MRALDTLWKHYRLHGTTDSCWWVWFSIVLTGCLYRSDPANYANVMLSLFQRVLNGTRVITTQQKLLCMHIWSYVIHPTYITYNYMAFLPPIVQCWNASYSTMLSVREVSIGRMPITIRMSRYSLLLLMEEWGTDSSDVEMLGQVNICQHCFHMSLKHQVNLVICVVTGLGDIVIQNHLQIVQGTK